VIDCASCGSPNAQGARYCAQCGASLALVCANCGAELSESARFCSACGTKVSEETAPGGRERRVVTLLFADVTGSTVLGERLDPERMREVLDIFFAAMKQEIEAEGGTLEKYIGDAIVAAFGTPVAHEDDPARALRAAIRMQKRLTAVNQELDTAFGVTLEIRIGVNTGEVLATLDPAPGESMFTGDAVNVAARFEQAAQPGEIVTSERTARSARRIRYRDLGPLSLKGKSGTIRAFVVEGESGEAERGIPGLRAPMVGRDSELSVLQNAYTSWALEGRPHLVTIYGEAGVGKSRLTNEFVSWARAQRPEPTIVRGRCLPYGDGITYWPLAEILKSVAGVLDTDPPAESLAKIRRAGTSLLTTAFAPDPARATDALAYTVGVEDPSLPFAEMEPRQVQAEARAAWRAFFSALTQPVVVVIEDIHWADPAMLELLEELADRLYSGVLFVCPARPELTQRRPDWGGGKRTFSSIALEPLSDTQADDLVTHLLAVDELPYAVRERILERAGGNPFFLEEIIRQLIDVGVIVRSGQRWRAAEGVVYVEIPDTVQGVLAARLDLLAPEEKRTIQLASVVGRIFWPGPVVELLGGDGSELYDVLGRLEARELIIERLGSAIAMELEYIFKHILTRDVAYESLPHRERAIAHAKVAEWMERMAGDRRGEFAELLAYHLKEAYRGAHSDPHVDAERVQELRRKALEALLSAAEENRRRGNFERAASLADSAVELAVTPLERAEALELKGLVAHNDYRGDAAWTSFKEAAEIRAEHLSDDNEALAAVCLRAAEVPSRWPGSMTGHPPASEIDALIQLGFANAPEGPNATRVQLMTLRAFGPFSGARERPVEAEEAREMQAIADEASAMARVLDRPDLVSAALDAASSTVMSIGMFNEVAAYEAERLELIDRLTDKLEIGDVFAGVAMANDMLGNYAHAREVAERGATMSDQLPAVLIHCLGWQIVAEFNLGHWQVVTEQLLPRVISLLGDRRDSPPYFVTTGYGTAAFILEAQGETAAARPLVAALTSILGDGRVGPGWLLPWIHLEAGRRDLAAPGYVELGVTRGLGRSAEEAARAHAIAEFEMWDRAPTYLAQTREYAAEAGLLALPFHLDRLEGRAALAGGDVSRAVSMLARAADGFGSLSMTWERACTLLFLADAQRQGRRGKNARASLSEATPVLEELNSFRELARARGIAETL
jgi:class 3 adenylate cyclase